MDMNMNMGMGGMPGMPAPEAFPTFYYAVVGSAVGVAALVNLYNFAVYRHRLSAARAGSLAPAKPKSRLALGTATLFALAREVSNFSFYLRWKDGIFRIPTIGRLSLVLANFIVLIVLCFFGQQLNNVNTMENVGFQCGFITISQLPLLSLLAGKNNIIGFLSGISYERLNWLHRWCARGMLLTATLHMGYIFGSWAPYDFIGNQIKNNVVIWKGLAAWCTLVWIVFSSMTPIRGWSYEFFVIQHLVSFTLFLVFIYLHTPPEAHIYIWIPVGLFFFDRGLRVLRVLYANLSIFHRSSKNQGQPNSFWACKAEFEPLPHDTTRIVIRNPPISWSPGQHVFLSCHSIVPLQCHPFTIASIPSDGRMEFLIKAQSGGTKHFLNHAKKVSKAPETAISTKTVTIEGPYGCHRPMRQFDSVVLLAGSTGVSFAFPLLRDLIEGWKEKVHPEAADQSILSFMKQRGAATRYIRFAWVVKSKNQLGWFSDHLSSVYLEFESLQERLRDVKLELTIYVTCDDSFTEEHKSLLSAMSPTFSSAIQQTSNTYGIIESRINPESEKRQELVGEKKEPLESTTGCGQSSSKEQTGCGPDGSCCCRGTVDDNSSSDGASVCCCCVDADSSQGTSLRSNSKPASIKERLMVHPSIKVYSGRPRTRGIIRKALEQAMGESAVVVCGPQGLVAKVKQEVCSLSDERAVHKGTGAQGIYLHTESFGY